MKVFPAPTGTEVKSLRTGHAQITEAYASPERGELWLINATIPEYLQANRFNHQEKRPRKLLVSKKDLAKLSEGVERAVGVVLEIPERARADGQHRQPAPF